MGSRQEVGWEGEETRVRFNDTFTQLVAISSPHSNWVSVNCLIHVDSISTQHHLWNKQWGKDLLGFVYVTNNTYMIPALVLHIDLNVQSLGLNNNILKLKLIGKKKLIQNVTWPPSFAPQTTADVRTHTACKYTPLGRPPLPPACILQQSPGSQRRQGYQILCVSSENIILWSGI